MRDEYLLRPTITNVVNDAQVVRLVEILKNKTSETPYALASVLCIVKAVFNKPYFPSGLFGKGKTMPFNFRGDNYVVEFVTCRDKNEHTENDSDVPTDVDASFGSNCTSQAAAESTLLSSAPQLIKPSIADIVNDDQLMGLVQLLKEKTKESPMALASILAVIKVIFENAGISPLFSSKLRFFHGEDTALREFVVEFDDARQMENERVMAAIEREFTNGHKETLSAYRSHEMQEESEDMMDELEKDEISEPPSGDNDTWARGPSNLTKRKRIDADNSDDDNFIHHNAPQTKRRTSDKHKAPPLSCEAVKRLFTAITRQTLLQRLEEARSLITSITESYSNIRQSTGKNPATSPRLNLLCHLLQSPPTSRIDGISSKVFSNLELYKLFTTYNAYKEELSLQTAAIEGSGSPRRNQLSPAPEVASLTFPTYSSFIDPTVTLHIKDQTGGKEVGKHRLNCAWRLSILCELLGKGVLLMTKELSGAKLERILVEEFSKLIDFLRNPDNQEWVSQVREKLDLPSFDQVYAPLAEADIVFAPPDSPGENTPGAQSPDVGAGAPSDTTAASTTTVEDDTLGAGHLMNTLPLSPSDVQTTFDEMQIKQQQEQQQQPFVTRTVNELKAGTIVTAGSASANSSGISWSDNNVPTY